MRDTVTPHRFRRSAFSAKRRLSCISFAAAAILLFAALAPLCGASEAQTTIVTGQGQVIGNGREASEKRPVTAVTTINLDGAFELALVIGRPPGLTLAGDENILPVIKTSVSDGRLDISSDRSYTTSRAVRVAVSMPRLENLSASGSNQIEASDFDSGQVKVALSGSNNAVLAGKIAALTVRLDGSNRFSAAQLVADIVEIRIGGSGEASVNARQRVVAEIFGSGSIAVHGNPKEQSTRVNGSGKITFLP